MTHKNIDDIISGWAKLGLNIYLSCSINDLDEEILSYLKGLNFNLDDYQSLVLLGSGGKTFGLNFQYPLNEKDHPFDTFTINQITNLDSPKILYPTEKYIPPLQKISRFFNYSTQSLLGLDISKEYGLWFSYRALFLTREKMPESKKYENKNICGECTTKECIKACPANAISESLFKLNLCADFRLQENSICSDRCHARLVCPYQKNHQYDLNQTQYHMTRLNHLQKLATFK